MDSLSNFKFIGIDLHSTQFTCCCLLKDKVLWRETFCLSTSGLDSFIEKLDKETYISVEASTGTFAFIDKVMAYVADYQIFDPRKLGLISMVKRKTDRIDAYKLAVFLKMQITTQHSLIKPVYIPKKEIQELRSLFTTYQQVTKLKTVSKNRIHSILKQNLLNYSKSRLFTKKVRAEILNLGLSDSFMQQISMLYTQIDFFEKQLADLEVLMKKIGKHFYEEINILTSMKGISVKLALAIIADICCIDRFPNAKHFCSYLRSTPSVDSSNQTTRIGKTCKNARKLSISLLTQSLNHFQNANPKLERWRNKKLSHKSKGKIRMAISRKVLVEIYHMLKKKEMHHHMEVLNHAAKMEIYDNFLKEHAA